MKKQILGFAFGFLMYGMVSMAEAVVMVPGYGDTGWQTYSTSFNTGFSGTVGFVVSDVIDAVGSPMMLIDNLSHAGNMSNRGFELGDGGGAYSFTPGDGSGFVLSDVNSFSWVWNVPLDGLFTSGYSGDYGTTEGDYMFFLDGYGEGAPGVFGGVDTSAFTNSVGMPGSFGSILETQISLAANEIFSFDWAFFAADIFPDFSAVYFIPDGTSNTILFQEVLGQVAVAQAPVPEPSTMILLGFGLVGLAGLARKKMKN